MDSAFAREELRRRIERLETHRGQAPGENEERLATLLEMGELSGISEEEVMEFAFECAVAMTGSEGGYLHFVSERAGTIDLVAWSKSVLATCEAEKTKHYPLDQAGIWADSVRLRRPVVHNDFQNEPDRRGYPQGHFQVRRHLSVPVFDAGRVVAIAGVGNKETDYDDSDVDEISLFMNNMWLIIKAKRAEAQLERM